MMMRAGVSYGDWRQMARFQRMDFLARRTIEMKKLADKVKRNDSLGGMLGLAYARLLGFDG